MSDLEDKCIKGNFNKEYNMKIIYCGTIENCLYKGKEIKLEWYSSHTGHTSQLVRECLYKNKGVNIK